MQNSPHHPKVFLFVGPNVNKTLLQFLQSYYYNTYDIQYTFVCPESISPLIKLHSTISDEYLLDSTLFEKKLALRVERLNQIACSVRSYGWYKQQFLKLKVGFTHEKSIIIDGDSLIKASIVNKILGKNLFFTREEPGNYLYSDLLNRSYICNFGYVESRWLVEWTKCSAPEEAFLWLLDQCIAAKKDFSEYQLFAYLAFRYNIVTKSLPLFLYRRADLLCGQDISQIDLRNIVGKCAKYDAICFETAHRRNSLLRAMALVALQSNHSW